MDNYELYHFGIKGQKWGVRRFQKKDGTLTPAGKKRASSDYKSTGLKSALARRSNEKVDKSFKDWKDNAQKRDNAIELGKKANVAKMAYEKNKSDKTLGAEYKQANKEYKKALKENTTYRKGVIRKEVGSDLSRKYLSEAKKVKKQMDNDPANKDLQKLYNNLMSKHDIERASARRAVEVGSKRSQKKAALKRAATMTVKAAASTAAVAGGVYAVNRYLTNHQFTLDDKPIRLSTAKVSEVVGYAKKVKDALGYLY